MMSLTDLLRSFYKRPTILFHQHGYFEFYDGLVSLELARISKDTEQWIKHANKNISLMKLKAKYSPQNCAQKLSLLEAELAALSYDVEKAEEHYAKAISLSIEHGFINDEALAHERAGLFFKEVNSEEKATQYLLKAYNCYKQWGAKAKMDHLIKTHPFLKDALNRPVSDIISSMEGVGVRSRSSQSASGSVGPRKKKQARSED